MLSMALGAAPRSDRNGRSHLRFRGMASPATRRQTGTCCCRGRSMSVRSAARGCRLPPGARSRITGGKECVRCAGTGRRTSAAIRCPSEDRGATRCDREGDELRDLRLGPAPLRRLHARHGIRRHYGPRVHGRSRGGRGGEPQAQGRRPGRGAVHNHLRRVRPVPPRLLFRVRTDQPQQGHRR
jgi:hypothetical protein